MSEARDDYYKYKEDHHAHVSLGYADVYIIELENEKLKWVSVKEELPKESGRLWCYVSEIDDMGLSHYQWNCCYSAEDNEWYEKNLTGTVTHWMPLPEPPKE